MYCLTRFIERGISIVKYIAEDCKETVHGQQLPKTFGDWVRQLCIIHGIRYHYGYAQELRGVT
ncbi:hypothetical protein PEX2_038100 [Penicillium expansum]|uniref:Uncharacterized protein n=1 Tax=Penicillium expansum TaxID=27334 RepID=A0A0A2J0N1_PENEN|nr:hypothetical protein PEX2_038100 [Penicillium expansum]KGO45950.1 hypothetical protein PEXP_018300 [Penicillium expansum]KGO54322.1 hypothetical protein PEX2_038100 [Penicillium expansum]